VLRKARSGIRVGRRSWAGIAISAISEVEQHSQNHRMGDQKFYVELCASEGTLSQLHLLSLAPNL
jgi:hypothetical protein